MREIFWLLYLWIIQRYARFQSWCDSAVHGCHRGHCSLPSLLLVSFFVGLILPFRLGSFLLHIYISYQPDQKRKLWLFQMNRSLFFFPQKPLENRWSYLNQTNTCDQNHATGWMAQGWVYLTSSQGCGFLGSSDDNESFSIVGDSVQSLGWEISWRRNWQPTPVFLPGGFHGQRSLVGYYPWGCRQSDTTEQLTLIKDVGKTISLTMA